MVPAMSVETFRTMTMIQAEKVPRPPKIAVAGNSWPLKWKLSAGFHGRSRSA